MRLLLCLLLAGGLATGTAVHEVHASENTPETAWITLDQDTYELLRAIAPAVESSGVKPLANGLTVNGHASHDRIHIVRIDVDLLDDLSRRVHEVEHHCGGYIRYGSLAAARASLELQQSAVAITRPTYEITHQNVVNAMLGQMGAGNIEQTILLLSDFQNRYYDSSYGAQASNWLADEWRAMADGRADITVEQIYRENDAQASVVLTIAGNELADRVLVVGAHLDSINHRDRNGEPYETARAPGADDDASGVASLTEALRVLMANNYQPQRTVKFMVYAAEEAGLLGSMYIAGNYAEQNVQVVGVLQLDMTDYTISPDDIFLVGDYTDSRQNSFLQAVAAAYLPALNVAYVVCGYACSDHASWTIQGYPASFPFESNTNYPYIHSSQDTYANLGNKATHALKFSRLTLAYIVELGDIAGGKVDNGAPVVLQNGVPATGLSGSQGSETVYTLEVPTGVTGLSFSISGGSGDADLYVKFGSVPTMNSYDCWTAITGNSENCNFSSPQAGAWYVMLLGHGSYSGVTLKAGFTAADTDPSPGDPNPGDGAGDNSGGGGGSMGVLILAWLLGLGVLRHRRVKGSSHP